MQNRQDLEMQKHHLQILLIEEQEKLERADLTVMDREKIVNSIAGIKEKLSGIEKDLGKE